MKTRRCIPDRESSMWKATWQEGHSERASGIEQRARSRALA